MKEKLLSKTPYLLILFITYYFTPLVIVDTGSAFTILLIVIPSITFIVSIVYGIKNNFNFLYSLIVALLFLPTIFIHYNSTALVYILIYFFIALLGNALGSIFCKK